MDFSNLAASNSKNAGGGGSSAKGSAISSLSQNRMRKLSKAIESDDEE